MTTPAQRKWRRRKAKPERPQLVPPCSAECVEACSVTVVPVDGQQADLLFLNLPTREEVAQGWARMLQGNDAIHGDRLIAQVPWPVSLSADDATVAAEAGEPHAPLGEIRFRRCPVVNNAGPIRLDARCSGGSTHGREESRTRAVEGADGWHLCEVRLIPADEAPEICLHFVNYPALEDVVTVGAPTLTTGHRRLLKHLHWPADDGDRQRGRLGIVQAGSEHLGLLIMAWPRLVPNAGPVRIRGATP